MQNLQKKEAAYEEAIASDDPQKIAKAEKKLAKAKEKYAKKVEKLEEKYGVDLPDIDERAATPEATPQVQEQIQTSNADPLRTDVYGNPIGTDQPATGDQTRQDKPREEQQPQQRQRESTGDPFIDMIMHIFELVMEIKRQRWEERMALYDWFRGKRDRLYTDENTNENGRPETSTPTYAAETQTRKEEQPAPNPQQPTADPTLAQNIPDKSDPNNLTPAMAAYLAQRDGRA